MGIVGRRRGGTVLFLRSGGRHGRRGKGTVKKCGVEMTGEVVLSLDF